MAFFFTDSSDVESRGHVQMLIRPGTDNPGSIVSVTSPPSPYASGDTEIPWGGFVGFKALITNIVIAEETNHQLRHTLGNDIYLTVFGDRIGALGIGGITSYNNCGEGGGEKIGIDHVLEYYRQTKLSARAEPLKITIAPDRVLRAYLYRFRGQVVDVAQRLFQFHLDMALIPERTFS